MVSEYQNDLIHLNTAGQGDERLTSALAFPRSQDPQLSNPVCSSVDCPLALAWDLKVC